MAAQNYPINQSASKNGRDLVEALDRIGTEWARVARLYQTMAESREATSDQDTSFVTPAKLFGFVADVGATDSTVSGATTKARGGFNEVGSMIAVCDAAIKQCTARFKQ